MPNHNRPTDPTRPGDVDAREPSCDGSRAPIEVDMPGWIAVPRDWTEDPIFRDAAELGAYVDLAARANWVDGVLVKRGQVLTSRVELAERWDWAPNRVKAYLDKLSRSGWISRVARGRKTLISVLRYDAEKGQNSSAATLPRLCRDSAATTEQSRGVTVQSEQPLCRDSAATLPRISKQGTRNKEPITTEPSPPPPHDLTSPAGRRAALGIATKPTRGKAPARYPAAFAAWWATYPRRIAKSDAYRAWYDLVVEQGHSARDLVTQTASYPHNPDPQYVPYPAGWLRARRWEDEHPTTTGGPDWTADASRGLI